MTTSISGLSIISSTEVVNTPSSTLIPLSVVMSRSAIFARHTVAPNLFWITSWFSARIFATPAPMVPNPINPTLIFFIFYPFQNNPAFGGEIVLKDFTDPSNSLTNPVLIFYKRKTDKMVASFTKTNPRCYRHLRLLQ